MSFLRRRRHADLAPDWEEIVATRVAHWAFLDEDERDRMAGLIAGIVTGMRWEAANGFELDDEIRTVIAAQAALLVLGLPYGLDAYRDVTTIIVHPTTMRHHLVGPGAAPGTETAGEVDLLGEADYRGPVVVAWDAAARGARHPERGHDVVLHEFAHKLDMLDTVVDGTPPLPDPEARRRWAQVCSRELDLLRAGRGGHLLDAYGATNVAEFFAVATEVFFDRPAELAHAKPDLYGVLRDFYRQDPALRVPRSTHPWG